LIGLSEPELEPVLDMEGGVISAMYRVESCGKRKWADGRPLYAWCMRLSVAGEEDWWW
jgi:hypothetical protein